MEDGRQIAVNHRIVMNNRKTCQITGIKDVISFTTEQALLETEMGLLEIKGTELHMNRLTLDAEEIDMDGEIESLVYSSMEHYNKPGESIFKKIFR